MRRTRPVTSEHTRTGAAPTGLGVTLERTVMAACRWKYVSKEQLSGFDNYKYSCIDSSPVSNYITHPFWNQVVKLCPSWLAPNLLTFTGFMMQVTGVIILTYYDYHFTAAGHDKNTPVEAASEQAYIPNWVWLLCAFLYFLAHTLDGIDGKQARRTNSSTPLGELFDHGLDSWATLFIPLPIYSIFGRSDEFGMPPIRVFFMLWAIMATFVMSHWEKYLTGVLYLPWGYDVSQIGLVLLYLITFIKGVTLWHFTIPGTGISATNVVEFGIYAGSVMSLIVSIVNIVRSYTGRTGKMLGVWEAVRPGVPIVWLFAVTAVWALLSHNNLLEHQPRCFFMMVGTVFANITCRLIISQMSQTRAESFNFLLVPLTVVSLVCGLTPASLVVEVSLLWTLLILIIISHLHYGMSVVHQLADHFNIYIFSLAQRTSHHD